MYYIYLFTAGVVNRVTVDHLGMLVFGTFNASISAKLIRNRFRVDENSEWIDTKNSQHVFGIGQTVLFEVMRYSIVFYLDFALNSM